MRDRARNNADQDAEQDCGRPRAPKIAVVANAKGGCGKTTVATCLAAALARDGARVALADADPQRGGMSWLARRPAAAAPIKAIDWTKPGPTQRRIDALASYGLDWLIVDSAALPLRARRRPPLWALIEQAAFVIAPITPSFYDESATHRFLALVENSPALREGRTELLLAANRVRARKRKTLRRDLGTFFERCGLAPTIVLDDRAAYPRLAAKGLTLFDRRAAKLAPLKSQWAPILAALGAGPSAARAAEAAARKLAA